MTPLVLCAQPFSLSDSSPDSEQSRARFLASYGVNSDVEPSFRPEDRVLYESIQPYLREDPRRAVQEVERVLGSAANPAFRFLLGNLYYELNEFDQAERALLQAIEAFPDFRRAYRTLGLIRIQQGRYPEAIESWLHVIRLGGGDAQSYGLLAYGYLATGRAYSALSAYRMARVFRPDSLDFRRGEAQSLMELGEQRKAIGLFDELIADHPDIQDFWLLQANLYLQVENYDSAIENLEVLHSFAAGSVDSHFMLGDLHLRDYNTALALRSYRAAVQHQDYAPRNLSRALQALRNLVDQDQLEAAFAFYDLLQGSMGSDLSERDQESLEWIEIRLALANGERSEAFTRLKALVDRSPLHAEALLLLGALYQESEDYAKAEFNFERVLSISHRRTDALIALGRMEVERGNWDAALRYLRDAERSSPRRGLRRYIESIQAAVPSAKP